MSLSVLGLDVNKGAGGLTVAFFGRGCSVGLQTCCFFAKVAAQEEEEMDLETLTVVTGVIYLLLSIRQNPYCWPVGIVSVVSWGYLAFSGRLYMDAFLQLVYVVLGFYGWWQWVRGGAHKPLLVRSATPWEWGIGSGVFVGLTAIFYTISLALEADFAFWDSLTTALCLVAQYMTAKKVKESFLLWAVANGIYTLLYMAKDWHALAWLMGVYTCLSFVGYRAWDRSMKGSQLGEAYCIGRG